MRIVIQLIILGVLWAVFGGVVAWLHPDAKLLMAGGPPARAVAEGEVTLSEAMAMAEKGNVLWIDVRPTPEFAKAHIPGAENIPADDSQAGVLGKSFFLWTQSGRLNHETAVIVYCASPGCGTSHQLRNELLRLDNLLKVHVLAGGWPEWRRFQERKTQ